MDFDVVLASTHPLLVLLTMKVYARVIRWLLEINIPVRQLMAIF
jgi:hypothetical protein